MTDPMLTTREIADQLHVTERTVVNLVHRGYFPGARKVDPLRLNSPYRIPASEFQQYLDLDQRPC